MNQEKIGKFIANSRKEKNMTQRELAEKLNVTDRAVSNWENGKNMPDLSMFKPICDCLDIAINDLLSGENIDEKSYRNKFEENVTNMVLYSRKKFYKKFLIIILIVILLLLIISASIFLSNRSIVNESYNNLIYDYNSKMIKFTIESYIIKSMPNNFTREDEKYFELKNVIESHIFKIDEVSNEEIYVYLWAIVGAHYTEEENEEKYIKYKNKTSKPYKFILKKTEGGSSYEVISVDEADITEEYSGVKSRKFIDKYFPEEIKETAKNFYGSKDGSKLFEKYWEIVEKIYLYY